MTRTVLSKQHAPLSGDREVDDIRLRETDESNQGRLIKE